MFPLVLCSFCLTGEIETFSDWVHRPSPPEVLAEQSQPEPPLFVTFIHGISPDIEPHCVGLSVFTNDGNGQLDNNITSRCGVVSEAPSDTTTTLSPITGQKDDRTGVQISGFLSDTYKVQIQGSRSLERPEGAL